MRTVCNLFAYFLCTHWKIHKSARLLSTCWNMYSGSSLKSSSESATSWECFRHTLYTWALCTRPTVTLCRTLCESAMHTVHSLISGKLLSAPQITTANNDSAGNYQIFKTLQTFYLKIYILISNQSWCWKWQSLHYETEHV